MEERPDDGVDLVQGYPVHLPAATCCACAALGKRRREVVVAGSVRDEKRVRGHC